MALAGVDMAPSEEASVVTKVKDAVVMLLLGEDGRWKITVALAQQS